MPKKQSKPLTLKSATTPKKRRQFMAEHPSPTNQARFDATLASMVVSSQKLRQHQIRAQAAIKPIGELPGIFI